MSNVSTRALIWVKHKVASKFPNQCFNKFHIKKAEDTIKSLDYVVGQIVLEHLLQLHSKLNYSFLAIDFWCFSKKTDFHYYISKELTKFWEIF